MNIESFLIGEYVLEQTDQKYTKIREKAQDRFIEQKLEWEYLPTVHQIATLVCEFYNVPLKELNQDRQLHYLVRIRRAVAFLTVKLYDPESLGILKHQLYHKKVVDGLRKELGKVIHRTGPAISHMIRGSVNEYVTDKQIKMLYHFLENQLYIEYGKISKF